MAISVVDVDLRISFHQSPITSDWRNAPEITLQPDAVDAKHVPQAFHPITRVEYVRFVG